LTFKSIKGKPSSFNQVIIDIIIVDWVIINIAIISIITKDLGITGARTGTTKVAVIISTIIARIAIVIIEEAVDFKHWIHPGKQIEVGFPSYRLDKLGDSS
jgi:hypothetical protein